MVTTSFREYWSSLPWGAATLPLKSPAALADLRAWRTSGLEKVLPNTTTASGGSITAHGKALVSRHHTLKALTGTDSRDGCIVCTQGSGCCARTVPYWLCCMAFAGAVPCKLRQLVILQRHRWTCWSTMA